MIAESWRMSPQRIDPLSWFTRPLIPLAFGAMLIVFAAATVAANWRLSGTPWLDVVAILVMGGACLLVQAGIRPLRPLFGPPQAAPVLVLAVAGLVLSAVSGADSAMLPQHWWAPVGAGFVVGALGPYSSVRAIVLYGAGLTVVAAACGVLAFGAHGAVWPPVSIATITGSAVVLATVATAVFSWVVVSSTRSLLGIAQPDGAHGAASEEAARRVERLTLARLGTRVAPFLESVADAGEVTASDRALAGQLARQLRSDLVRQADRSWLDRIALFGRITVVDPDVRADRMNPAQRTALRALLAAVIDHPATAVGSLFIELRGEDDGSTAVALSFDFTLPEGRRAMMLAPYYLTLQTTVSELIWDPVRDLLSFQVPAARDAP